MKNVFLLLFISVICSCQLYAQYPKLKKLSQKKQLEEFVPVFDKKMRYGYANTSGKILINCVFQETYPFSGDYAYVLFDNKYGIVSRTGEYLTPPIFEKIIRLNDSHFCALKDNYWYLINHTGVINDGKYTCMPSKVDDNLLIVSKDNTKGHTGVVSYNGKEIVDCKYDEVRVSDHHLLGTLFFVSEKNKWGIFNTNGKRLLDVICDSIQENYALNFVNVKINNKWGIMHNSGSFIVRPYLDRVVGENYFFIDNKAFMLKDADLSDFKIKMSKYKVKNSLPDEIETALEKAKKADGFYDTYDIDGFLWKLPVRSYEIKKDDYNFEQYDYINKSIEFKRGNDIYTYPLKSRSNNGKISLYYNTDDKCYYIYNGSNNYPITNLTGEIPNDIFVNAQIGSCTPFADGFFVEYTYTTSYTSPDRLLKVAPVYTTIFGKQLLVQPDVANARGITYYTHHQRYVITDSHFRTKKTIIGDNYGEYSGPHSHDFRVTKDGDLFLLADTVLYRIDQQGDIQWQFDYNDGKLYKDIVITDNYIYASATTLKKGYIGFNNPGYIQIDKKTGMKTDSFFVTAKGGIPRKLKASKNNVLYLYYDDPIRGRDHFEFYIPDLEISNRKPTIRCSTEKYSNISISSYAIYSQGKKQVTCGESNKLWEANVFNCDRAVIKDKKSNFTYIINPKGEIVFDNADGLFDWVNPQFVNGLLCAKKNGKWGFLNSEGKIVIPYQYDKIDNYMDGIALVCKEGLWYYIDNKGDLLCNTQLFVEAHPFYNGFACAITQDSKTVIINLKGDIIYENPASIGVAGDGLLPIDNIIIDQDGKKVIEHSYDEIYGFFEGLAKVRDKELYGFINKSGEIAIPIVYKKASNFVNGFAVVIDQHDTKFMIDNKGNRYDIIDNDTFNIIES